MKLLLGIQLEHSTDSLMLVVQSISSLDELLLDVLKVLVKVGLDDVVMGGHLVEINGLFDEFLETDEGFRVLLRKDEGRSQSSSQ